MEKIVLFDGSRESLLANWTMLDGTAANWICDGSAMTVNRGNIVSKLTYGDAHIHLEWREPDMPWTDGQFKGNSGVFVQGVYELQVLDSYGIAAPDNRDCGSIYNKIAPLVNACRPALVWQSYDIYFRAPRFDEAGSVVEHARMTVLQNDQLILNNIEIDGACGGTCGYVEAPMGPLMLQDHGDPVSFRNIWIEKY